MGPFPEFFPSYPQTFPRPSGAGDFYAGPLGPLTGASTTPPRKEHMVRSRYSYVHRDGAVLIEDLIGQVSVAGDIENVVTDLVDRGIDVDRMIIVYRDIMGRWDRVLTSRRAFLCFEAVDECDGWKAVEVCRQRDARDGRPQWWRR